MANVSLGSLWRRFWRIPVVAVAAGLLAFVGSYVFPPQYQATTRILIRARESTIVTATGDKLSSQQGVFDSTLTKAISDTQSALLNNNAIASTVVERLDLDAPDPEDSSLVARTRSGIRTVIKHSTALVIHGGYKEPDQFDAAVEEVRSGLSASQGGDGYMLDLRATADEPELAVAIANVAADELVRVGEARARKEAIANRNHFAEELRVASVEEEEASRAVREFLQANSGASVDLQVELNAETRSELQTQLAETDVALAAAKAQLASLEQSLRDVAPRSSSSSAVQTGRSTTVIDETAPSGAHEELVVARSQAASDVASNEAKQARLQAALNPGSGVSALPAEKRREFDGLELRLRNATDATRQLRVRYEDAVVIAAGNPIELTRIDEPQKPNYPVAPKRYLYLGMGLVAGAVVGLLLSAFAAWRRGERLFADADGQLAVAHHGSSARRDNGAAEPKVDVDLVGAVHRAEIGGFEIYQAPPGDGGTHGKRGTP
jgi:uncharacterized protein involved in exopolysaccharide biosynthesis